MSLSQTEYGKAYEYACLLSLKNALSMRGVRIVTIRSMAYETALSAYEKAEREKKSANLIKAADAAIRVIMRLEPQLERGNGTLSLSIQNDAQGIVGDVRDLVFVRSTEGWEVGISCKHNHHAVKHSRLSSTIDFGNDWFGIGCSQNYFDTIRPIFGELRRMRTDAIEGKYPIPLWRDIPNKAERFYLPVLHAFANELRELSHIDHAVPSKLIRYMLGRYDFYKVITDDRHRTTRIEAINIHGTLNRYANGYRSIVDVPKVQLPNRFFHIGMVPYSDNTLEIVCDEGWTLEMRIHSAKSEVEPSLKFDVRLVSIPNTIHAQVEPWDNY
jgi:hypothetical protein